MMSMIEKLPIKVKHLTLDDRKIIQLCIDEHLSKTEFVRRQGKTPFKLWKSSRTYSSCSEPNAQSHYFCSKS